MKHLFSTCFLLFALTAASAVADLSDDFANLQNRAEETLLDLLGGQTDAKTQNDLRAASDAFSKNLTDAAAKALARSSARFPSQPRHEIIHQGQRNAPPFAWINVTE